MQVDLGKAESGEMCGLNYEYHKKLSDPELIELLKNGGDREIIMEVLIERHAAVILGCCSKEMKKDPVFSPEDIAAKFWSVLYKGAIHKKIKKSESIKSWAISTLANMKRDAYRKRANHNNLIKSVEAIPADAKTTEEPWEIVAAKEIVPLLMPRLTPQEAEVFEHLLQGKTNKDIAETMSKNITHVRKVTSCILAKWKKLVNKLMEG